MTAKSIAIELTEGAVTNGYLRIPPEQTLFPDQYWADDEGNSPSKFVLNLPNGEQRQTCILRKYSRIQARFGALFNQLSVKPGDIATLKADDVLDGHYHLSFSHSAAPATKPQSDISLNQTPAADMSQSPSLNTILYGPPGTGKTYATIDAALAILAPNVLTQDRAARKARFDELAAAGAIRFVTFHQSFSYEDFVEGLRASSENGSVRYDVEDGVFKQLCISARSRVERVAEAPKNLAGRRIWKMSLGNTQGADAVIYEQCLTENCVLLGYGGDVDFAGCTSRKDVIDRFTAAGNTIDKPSTDYGVTSVTAFVTRMQVGDIVVISDGNFRFRAIGEITGDYVYKPHAQYSGDYSQYRPVKWLRTYSPSRELGDLMNVQFSQMTLYELSHSAIDMGKLERLLDDHPDGTRAGLFAGQRFGQGYVVKRVSQDVIKLEKPHGGLLPMPFSIVEQLLRYVRLGKISVEDIRKGQVFEKVQEAELEKYIVNGYQSLLAAMVSSLLLVEEGAEPDAKVLIIDEINRGNISRIFGELITLIEPSKRAGADEALSVMLPYSKQPFSVPSNVYLIGTMNTADRSLAGLDIALRRRFTFKEMPPQPALLDAVDVEGINVGQLLRTMNQRIEVLLDRDHCLGHAYFLPLDKDRTLAKLGSIFRNQVLPLLQEYFFEDWQRIQWVLNDHRKADTDDRFVYQSQQDVKLLFGDGVNAPSHNLPWHINDAAFGRTTAYLGIIGPSSQPTNAQQLALQASASLQASEDKVIQEASYESYLIRRLASGTIEVWRDGVLVTPTLDPLREMANKLSVPHLYDHGGPLNTRELGRRVILAIEANAT